MNVLSERFELRLDQDTLRSVDEWRSGQSDVPNRSEAVRRLVEQGLGGGGEFRFSKTEMLIVLLLADIIRASKLDTEFDAKLIQGAVIGGHLWALDWEFGNAFPRRPDSRHVVCEVANYLDMWDFVELSYEKLAPKDRKRIEKEADPFGTNVEFRGFDANNESEHFGVAQFMVHGLGRFSRYKKRELNSHSPKLEGYRRMYGVFDPIRPKLGDRRLSADEVIQILNAKTHPSLRGKKT